MMPNDSMANPYEELRRLRDELAEVVNYLQAGGTLSRGGYHALQLQRLHRESRPAAMAPVEAREEYWQQCACGWAFDCGRWAAYVDGSWAVLLDMMLERGGEVGDDARLLAQHLGIELRESYDGGKTWHPLRRLSFLRDMSTDALAAELTRRGWFRGDGQLAIAIDQTDGLTPEMGFTYMGIPADPDRHRRDSNPHSAGASTTSRGPL